MRKILMLCLVSLVILWSLVLVTGCLEQPTPTPEPSPSEPTLESVPSTVTPEPTPPIQLTPGPEPTPTVSPTPGPEPTPPLPPTPTPESVPTPPTPPEPTPEPTIHSSAYIKFEGIDGESDSVGHEGWSEIVSFNQAIHTPGSGTGTSRSRADAVFDEIVVVRQIDKASPKLAESVCKNTVFGKVEIHLTGPSEGSTCEGTFYAYELTSARITSYRVTGSNPLAYALIAPAPDSILPYSGPFIVQAVDAPMEEITINFTEIKVTYTECDKTTGMAKGNVEYTWKIEESES